MAGPRREVSRRIQQLLKKEQKREFPPPTHVSAVCPLSRQLKAADTSQETLAKQHPREPSCASPDNQSAMLEPCFHDTALDKGGSPSEVWLQPYGNCPLTTAEAAEMFAAVGGGDPLCKNALALRTTQWQVSSTVGRDSAARTPPQKAVDTSQ